MCENNWSVTAQSAKNWPFYRYTNNFSLIAERTLGGTFLN